MNPQVNVPTAAKVDSGLETIQKLLMIFIFILTVCFFSFWGFQSVRYILAISYNASTTYTPYDMFIGVIAMLSSVALFAGSFMWWRKNVSAKNLLVVGSIGFMIKDILEIPNALVPLNLIAQTRQVTGSDISMVASAIGVDLFKIGFWIFALCIFLYAIKKYMQSGTV